MNRVAGMLGTVGVALGIGGLVAYGLAPEKLWLVSLLEGVAVVCLILFFVVHFETVKAFSVRRSTRLGANSLLMVALFAGILAIVNFLAARHSTHWDLSETQSFTLAPQTYGVLRGLGREVRVTVFSQDRSQGQTRYKELLAEYGRISDKIKVTYVDPDRNPGLARQYGISRLETAVVESGDQSSRIATPAEAELTSAIIRVAKDAKKRILFLEGHGEHSLIDQERSGMALAKEALLKQAYEVHTVNLLTQETVPPASALVLAGPQRPLTPEEIARLSGYIAGGGHVLLLVDPDADANLGSLLQPVGVELGKGVLVDLQDRVAQGAPTALLTKTFFEHDITRDLTSFVIFPAARHLVVHDDQAKDWSVLPLARTSPMSWAETNVATLKSGVLRFDQQEDVRGPLPLAVAVTPKKVPEEGKPAPALVVIGNSQFATNTYLNFPGNTDFFLHTVGWLADERDFLSIAPKEPAFRPFIPNPTQERLLLLVQVLMLPALTFVWGISTWMKRRRL